MQLQMVKLLLVIVNVDIIIANNTSACIVNVDIIIANNTNAHIVNVDKIIANNTGEAAAGEAAADDAGEAAADDAGEAAADGDGEPAADDAGEAAADDAGEPAAEKNTAIPWLDCSSNVLAADEDARLARAVTTHKVDIDEHPPGYYRFLQRVCRIYKDDHNAKDVLHANRDTVLGTAIQDVFQQIRPCTHVPHDGDAGAALKAIIATVQDVFEMPPAGPVTGSDEWVKWMCRRPKGIHFSYAAKFPQLMKKLVLYFIKKGDANGFPPIKTDEEIPDGEYQERKKSRMPRRVRRTSRNSHKAHKSLRFLNMTSVNNVILILKNLGLYPVRVDAKNMPNGEVWDNFAEVLYTFWIYYCDHQGVVKSSLMARKILLYLFYGVFDGPRGRRKWPVVRGIHRYLYIVNVDIIIANNTNAYVVNVDIIIANNTNAYIVNVDIIIANNTNSYIVNIDKIIANNVTACIVNNVE